MILISVVYILDFLYNEQFTYEAMTFYNHTDDYNEIKRRKEDPELNPYMNFSAKTYDENIHIFEEKDGIESFFQRDKKDSEGNYYYNFQRRINDIGLVFVYSCGNDENCSLLKEIINEYKTEPYDYAEIDIEFRDYKIIHKNDPPVDESHRSTLKKSLVLQRQFYRLDEEHEFETIRYNDQKSLFDFLTKRKTEYIFEHIIKNITHYEFPESDDFTGFYFNEEIGFAVPVYYLEITNSHDNYLYYKRKKISFLDVLANIGALFSTIKFVFSFIFSFYSTNFNNYKIVGNILSTHEEQHKEIELSSDFNISLSSRKENKKIKIDNDALIDKESYENQNNIKDYGDDNDAEENYYPSNIIDSMHFYDFFYNNIYSKCCCRIRNQEILNMTNEIMYKYLSIDSLLYNQIKLEQLFKDYKWNNPKLKNIKNNKMLTILKNI